jgi:hypothetical protein
MVFYKKILTISLLCSVVSIQASVHEVGTQTNLPDEIVQAFAGGDAKVISKYFNSSVELIFSIGGGVYGKAQAEQMLKNFFANNDLSNKKFIYRNLHSSNKDNQQSYIGELTTGKGSYRVNIYMKDQLIHLMRIESND